MDIRKFWAWLKITELDEAQATIKRYQECLSTESSYNTTIRETARNIQKELNLSRAAYKTLEEDCREITAEKEAQRQEFTNELLALVAENKKLRSLLTHLNVHPLFIAPEEVKPHDGLRKGHIQEPEKSNEVQPPGF